MLPRPLTLFVGRQAERRALLATIRTHPIASVVGPPGVGKTRLAVEVVRDLASEYQDRCWFVDLAPVSLAELIPPTMLAALDVPSRTGDAVADIVRYIGADPALILLDNCEHLVSAVADLAILLLDRCAGVRLVATSRSELGIAGEQIAGLHPFDIVPGESSHAVDLFFDRANSRGAGLQRSAETERQVARICAQLDGLPLAIELAASRARTVSLAVLEELLAAPLEALTSESQQSSTPQRSLHDSITWSHRLCDEHEKHAWEILSVFAGSFDFAAARAVLEESGTTRSVVELVDALVARSMLQTVADGNGQRRYRMLETLRSFARQRLQERQGEQERVRLAHASWYARGGDELETGWVGPGQGEKLRAAEQDLSNFREATEYSIARSDPQLLQGLVLLPAAELWWATGRLEEGRYWLRRVLDVPGLPDAVRIRTLVLAATFAYGLRLLDEGDDCVRQLTDRVQGVQDPYARGARAYAAGFGEIQHGEAAAAIRTLSAGARIADADPALLRMTIRTRQLLVYAHNMLGDYAEAARLCDEIAAYSARSTSSAIGGEEYFSAFTEQMYAFYAWRDEDREAARRHALRAVDASLKFPNRPENVDLLVVCALIEKKWGSPRRAVVLLAAAGEADRIGLRPATVNARDVAESITSMTAGTSDPSAYSIGASMTSREALVFARGRSAGTERLDLTPRESEIMHLVRLGMANKQIARTLGVSPKTVEGHLTRLMAKLGVSSRVHVATWNGNLSRPDSSPGA